MAGTRTAPTVDGAGYNYIAITLRWQDYTGDWRSDTYKVDPSSTPAQIEALAAELQTSSRATLYEIKVSEVYASNPQASNAEEAVWENAATNVVIQAKEPGGTSVRCFLPAPVDSIFVEGTDNVDPTDTDFTDITTAFLALLDAAYDVVGARFTHRRDINQQTKL